MLCKEGLSACDCELVARMDSDDIALPLRMEHQLAAMNADPGLSVVGGQIAEFTGTMGNIQGYRMVPVSPEKIRQSAARRNPMNHMTVLFRKADVLTAGGYQDLKGFEDYFRVGPCWQLAAVWQICRRYASWPGYPDSRRAAVGGIIFCQTVRLEHALRTCGLIGAGTYCQNLLIRFGGTVLLPDALRQRVYQRFLRRGRRAPEMPWAGTPEELTAAASQS